MYVKNNAELLRYVYSFFLPNAIAIAVRYHLEASRNEVANIVSCADLDDDLAIDLSEVKVGVGLHDPQLAFVVNSMSCPNGYQVLDLLLMAPVEEVVVELENITYFPLQFSDLLL
jgi:hypothetical protein